VRNLCKTFGKVFVSNAIGLDVVSSIVNPQGPASGHRAGSADVDQGAETTASGPGKFFGRGSVTLPVAAHSVPRSMTDWKPTHFME